MEGTLGARMESGENPAPPRGEGIVCTGISPSSIICWWAHLVKDISYGICQTLFKKREKKTVKDISHAGLVTWSSHRWPKRLGAQDPPSSRVVGTGAQDFAWVRIGLASARKIFGLNKSF